MHTRFFFFLFLGVALLLAACQRSATLRPHSPSETPRPAAGLLGQFLWQANSDFAYVMLRPAGRQAVERVGRAYLPPAAKTRPTVLCP